MQEHVVVGEGGKVYVRGRLLGERLVTGEQACLELQVKNHTSKKVSLLVFHVIHADSTSSIDYRSNFDVKP